MENDFIKEKAGEIKTITIFFQREMESAITTTSGWSGSSSQKSTGECSAVGQTKTFSNKRPEVISLNILKSY